ncbi:cell division protein DivIC [Streptococcus pneumoniae GA16833]|nr:cell division protein DivIC [Streptococcus pneumoniae GA16833]
MSKNIVQLNNSFIQNEYQRRRYLMKERQNGIVLWEGY